MVDQTPPCLPLDIHILTMLDWSLGNKSCTIVHFEGLEESYFLGTSGVISLPEHLPQICMCPSDRLSRLEFQHHAAAPRKPSVGPPPPAAEPPPYR